MLVCISSYPSVRLKVKTGSRSAECLHWPLAWVNLQFRDAQMPPLLDPCIYLLKLLSQYPEGFPVFLLSQPEYQFSVGPTQSPRWVICARGVIFVSKDIMKRRHWIQNASAQCLGNIHSTYSQFQLRYLQQMIIKKRWSQKFIKLRRLTPQPRDWGSPL